MQISDLTVEVRDSSLARVGQILPADLVGFEASLRFNKVGSWKIALRSDHPLVDTLRAPGSGIIVTGPTGVLLSGPTASAKNTKTAADPTGVWEIVGTDDGVILGERLAYPVPASASLASQTVAYDVRTGKAETVAKAYVDANIGPSAPAARKISALTIDTDLARGSTVVASARFDKLGQIISSLLVLDGLGFDIKQSGSTLVFEVFAPVDRSDSIRMDVDNLRLEKSEYTYQRPEATRVIVAGQGQGGERAFVERSSAASTSAESAWGRRIEVFKDSRNTADTAELQIAGDEILAAGGKTLEGIKVTPSDDQTMRYGVDWGLGDKVTVVIGSTQVAQVVTEVAIVVTENGIKIGATVGEPGVLEDYEAGLLSASTDQSARITALEVNESTGGVNASSITTGTMDINRLPTIPLLTNTSDTLTVGRGGTGATTLASGAYLKGAGTSAVTAQTGIPATDITSGTLDDARLPTISPALGGTGLTTGSGLVPIVPTSATTGSVGSTGTVTWTSQNSISVNGAFTTAYTRYRIFIDYNTASMTGSDATWLLRSSGSNITASNYAYAGRRHINWAASDVWGIGGAGWLLMNGNAQSGTYTQSYIDIMYPRQTSRTFISQHSYLYGPTYYGSLLMGGQYNATTAVDGFTITFSASSTGTIKIYGYN